MNKIFPKEMLRTMKSRYMSQGLSEKKAEENVAWELAEINKNSPPKSKRKPKMKTPEEINDNFKSKFRELTNGGR